MTPFDLCKPHVLIPLLKFFATRSAAAVQNLLVHKSLIPHIQRLALDITAAYSRDFQWAQSQQVTNKKFKNKKFCVFLIFFH
jgi:hypothetical protein